VLNEVYKLFSREKTLVFLIIMAAVSFLCAFFISSIQARIVFIAMNSISYPLMILSIYTNVFLPIFVFMAASELFPGEIADRTLKLVLTMPISRFKIYISKITAIGIYVILNFLIIFLVSTASALCLRISILSISQVIFGYLIDIIPALILIIFTAFIVQFFRNGSAALVSCILIFIGIKVLSLLSAVINNNIFTTYMNWYSLWLAGGTNPLKTLNIFLLVLSYGIIFFTAGYYLFDKKEV
jgi:ABC-2 type transport system permease protein